MVMMMLLGLMCFIKMAEGRPPVSPAHRNTVEVNYRGMSGTCRKHSASLTDFGGVGDGKTSNTKAFKAAVDHLSQYASDGGALLLVPPGRWLTGSFNLTSHFTLFIHKDAVVLASQVGYILHLHLCLYSREIFCNYVIIFLIIVLIFFVLNVMVEETDMFTLLNFTINGDGKWTDRMSLNGHRLKYCLLMVEEGMPPEEGSVVSYLEPISLML